MTLHTKKNYCNNLKFLMTNASMLLSIFKLIPKECNLVTIIISSLDLILAQTHAGSCPSGGIHGLSISGATMISGWPRSLVIPVLSDGKVSMVTVSPKVKGWKDVLTNGSQNDKGPSPCLEEEIIATSTNFTIPDTVSDRIVSLMDNVAVGHFIYFRPTVDMVRGWNVTKWSLKGSVDIFAMEGGIFSSSSQIQRT